MNWTHTTCKVVRAHSHWGTGYRFSSKHTYSCNHQQSSCWGQAGSAREVISITTMLEFVESAGTMVLLSELTTLVRTSSSEPSMEFRICTAPGIPVRQNPKPKTMWLGTFLRALIFILIQPAEKSYLASITWLLKEAQGKAKIVLLLRL